MWKKIKDLFSAKIDDVNELESDHARITSQSGEPEPGKSSEDSEPSGPHLSDLIRQHLAPVLRADGFTGSGRNFRKNHHDWVLVFSVETSRAGDAFALNIGVQPKFAPDSLGKEVDPKKIKVQLCEFRRRVFTPEIEVWWRFEASTESMVLALQSAAQAYVQQMRAFVRDLCSEHSVFSSIAVEQFSVEALGFGQFDTTEGRLALAIARYHSKHENWQRAEAFASLGLKYVGISVGLQRDLEEVICFCKRMQDETQIGLQDREVKPEMTGLGTEEV